MRFLFDLDGEGLHTIFQPYQVRAWKHLVRYKVATSREIHDEELKWAESLENVDEVIPMSRASIINFLKDMATRELLLYSTKTGKGGYHRVYETTFNSLDGLKTELRRRIVEHANGQLFVVR